MSCLPMPQAWLTPVIGHPVQDRLVSDHIRFKTVPAGRRSGKTFRFKRHLVSEAMRYPGLYFAGAPTRDQAKRIFWKDLDSLLPPWFRSRSPSLSDLVFYLRNGSEIHVLGMDKPARIEGTPWQGGGIDEFGDCKPEAWPNHIRPALSTIGLNAWCWLLGVPEGLNHYYDLCEYAKSGQDPEWRNYTWKSSDILPPREVEAAKRQLSAWQFRQEYEASFEGATGRVYADYSEENHTQRTEIDRKQPLIWAHDFNFTPLSSVIAQEDAQRNTHCLDEIVLESAVALQAAKEFCERYAEYKGALVKIYGDASGKAGEKHGHESDYIAIEKELKRDGFRVQRCVPGANGAIKDSQNSLRARICNALGERHFFVNPMKCRTLERGLKTLQFKAGSTFQEEEGEFQHITTAARYYTAREFPAISHTVTVQQPTGW